MELLGLRRNSWRRGSGPSRAADGNGGQVVSADALYWNRELIEAELSLARELKLLLILAAYLQSDLIRERLGRPGPLAALTPEEIESLEGFLVPGPALLAVSRSRSCAASTPSRGGRSPTSRSGPMRASGTIRTTSERFGAGPTAPPK